MTLDPKYCQEEVWDGFHHYQCSHKAVVFHNGKGYCRKHDPIAVADKREKERIKHQEKCDNLRHETTRKNNAIELYTLLEEHFKTTEFEVIKQRVLNFLKEETK